MTKWAAGLLVCAAGGALALALLVVSRQVGGKQEAPAAAGSGPEAPAYVPMLPAYPPVVPASALEGMSYAQRYAVMCAVCHGASGRIEIPITPVLAGQSSLYVITQLFLFREGRRSHEAMTAVARALSDDDLQGYADFIATLPAVPPPPLATPPDPERMARGRALAEQHKCLFCHGPALAGGQQVPLIGGQHEQYLQLTLRGFHSGARPGYTQAMTAAMSQIPAEDLEPLAYFVARFPGPLEPLTGQ